MYTILRLAIFLFIYCATPALYSQVVTTVPAFPLTDGAVTVHFDAREGNGGLEGYTGDVYAHTGVITSASSGPSDWKICQNGLGREHARNEINAHRNKHLFSECRSQHS